MAANRTLNPVHRTATDARPIQRPVGNRFPGSNPFHGASAALNRSAMASSPDRGSESIEAGPRDRDRIPERIAVAASARTPFRQWIHPATAKPCAGPVVQVNPVPAARHAAPVGEAYVYGPEAAVCVRVDKRVRGRDRADFPTTNTNWIK